jgi:hypothetical protein
MNVAEGFRRVAIVIRWLGFLAALGCLAAIVSVQSWADRGMIFLIAAFLTAASQGIAWMIDGFAAPHK